MLTIAKTFSYLKHEEFRLACRGAITAAAAYFICVPVLHLNKPEWGIFTAIVCVQSHVGASLRFAWERFLGTIIACALVFTIKLYSPVPNSMLALCFFVGFFLFMQKREVSIFYSTMAVSFGLIMLYFILQPDDWETMLSFRLEDIAVGVLVGTTGALFIFPQFSTKDLTRDLKSLGSDLENFNSLLSKVHENWDSLQIEANETQIRDKITKIRLEIQNIRYEFRTRKDKFIKIEHLFFAQEKKFHTLIMRKNRRLAK